MTMSRRVWLGLMIDFPPAQKGASFNLQSLKAQDREDDASAWAAGRLD